MKNIFIAIALFVSVGVNAQIILPLPTVIQSQNQWCWSACSNCILTHYGVNTTQCQIAEYNRTVSTWHNFGTADCCVTPGGLCNYWNYMWGYAGSIEDILSNFGSLTVANVSNTISISAINTEITAGRPFTIRWGWTSGGGHFIVGKGFDASNNIYYMNPWPGEGAKMSTYPWLVNDGVHSWTHTQKLTTNPPTSTSIKESAIDNGEISIYPNPTKDKITITSKEEINRIELFDVAGKEILTAKNAKELNLTSLNSGIYFLKISGENFSVNKKVVVE